MPAAFVLLYNVTLLKDFYNSRLINFSTAYTRHPSVSPHPLCQSSSPFVKLQSPYTWQYRLQHQSVGTKGWAERWGEGEETCDKTRWIERRREKESVLPRTCQPFYYHDVCAFITVPANKNLLKPMGRQLCWDLVECEQAWTVHWSVRHLSFTCVGCREGHWKMCRGQAAAVVSETHLFKERFVDRQKIRRHRWYMAHLTLWRAVQQTQTNAVS